MQKYVKSGYMETKIVQSRVKSELKIQADQLFAQIGLSTADAIRMFLQQSVNIGGLPFTPKAKQLNVKTLDAIKEFENGEKKSFQNIDDLMKDLHEKD